MPTPSTDTTDTAFAQYAKPGVLVTTQWVADHLDDPGVRILEYPTMLHAKAFVRDGEELLVGTCNLEAWSLKRFFEIDLQLRSPAVAAQFDG